MCHAKFCFKPSLKRLININVISLIIKIGSRSSVCNKPFEKEAAFKDHYLITIHNSGSPSEGMLGK